MNKYLRLLGCNNDFKDSKKMLYYKMLVQQTIVPHKEGTGDNMAMQ